MLLVRLCAAVNESGVNDGLEARVRVCRGAAPGRWDQNHRRAEAPRVVNQRALICEV